jgi:hypothetical protein
MYAQGSAMKIGVYTTHYDSSVIARLAVQTNEIYSVLSHEGSVLLNREFKHILVGDSLICLSGVLRCRHVMA